MKVVVTLESPSGETIPEIAALRSAAQSELDAVDDVSGVQVSDPRERHPPEGAQGIAEAVMWVAEFVSNNPGPTISALLFALREALNYFRGKSKQDSDVTIKVQIGDDIIDLGERDLAIMAYLKERGIVNDDTE